MKRVRPAHVGRPFSFLSSQRIFTENDTVLFIQWQPIRMDGCYNGKKEPFVFIKDWMSKQSKYMKKNTQNIHHVIPAPRRVASRMEGVVKNIGTNPIKKQKKG